MPNDQGQIVIRKATEAYVGQIAEILVEDWKRAYRGIMDSAFLDAMSAEQRYPIELQRYQKYTVVADGQIILGYAWNEMIEEETADCEIRCALCPVRQEKKWDWKDSISKCHEFFPGSGQENHDRMVSQRESRSKKVLRENGRQNGSNRHAYMGKPGV